MGLIYTDEGTEYPELNQPDGYYVKLAEEELDDPTLDSVEVTWPQVHERAWELQLEAEPDDDD